MEKILILGVASVQADAISILNQMGFDTYACAMAKDGPGADLANHFDIINILDAESIQNHIVEKNISAVYSVGSDLAMPIACKVSEALNLPHFVSSDTATICNNKNLMRETLGSEFKGNVRYQVMDDISELLALEFPFIVKPSDAQGQRGVKLVHTQADFEASFKAAKHYSRSGYVILEQYISGKELSVNGYLVDGELRYLEVSERVTWDKFLGLIHKHIVPSADCEDISLKDKVRDVIGRACRSLNIQNGPVYAQMKLMDNEPYIIEITPRLDGCHMWNLLHYYSNVNLLKLCFEHLLHGDVGELDRYAPSPAGIHTLEFFCQEPNTIFYRTAFVLPENFLTSYFYYDTGDQIRPVNNQFEKVGYVIYKNERC